MGGLSCPHGTPGRGWASQPCSLWGWSSSGFSGRRMMMEAEQMVKLDEACVCSTLTFLPARAQQGLEPSHTLQ